MFLAVDDIGMNCYNIIRNNLKFTTCRQGYRLSIVVKRNFRLNFYRLLKANERILLRPEEEQIKKKLIEVIIMHTEGGMVVKTHLP